MKRNTILPAASAVVLMIAAFGCGGSGGTTQSVAPVAPVSARVAVAEPAEVPVLAEATGTVEAWRRVSLGTKILGRVSELTAREGDRVHSGQVVARLESADLEAAVAQARAALAMAQASLESAETQHARMEQLHAQRSVTDKNLEDAAAAHRVAVAKVDVMRANLDAAEVLLSYATVSTPIDGWVSSRPVEVGDMVAPGQPMLVVEDLSRVKVRVDVPESVVAGLAPGQSAGVTILGAQRQASIDRIAPAGDPGTRTFSVQMLLDNADARLRAGMFARAAFATGARHAVLVPDTAVVERGQLTGVLIVDEINRARLRWIKLGSRIGDHTEVLSGLHAGERYVLEVTADVHDGTEIAAVR